MKVGVTVQTTVTLFFVEDCFVSAFLAMTIGGDLLKKDLF